MFDWYEPSPPLACPRCDAALGDWQGKDWVCGLWVWRQGCADPIDQRVDPQWRSARATERLPAQFEIYTKCVCGQRLDAWCAAPEGIWTRTALLTVPMRPRRGKHGGWACPCCGCFTLADEPPGTFEICPVCFWEDDRVQFESPDDEGGANALCLREARRSYLLCGSSDRGHRSRVRSPRPDELE